MRQLMHERSDCIAGMDIESKTAVAICAQPETPLEMGMETREVCGEPCL